VDEYTLSLFTASLSVAPEISYTATQFPITINAEYTFKQPVSGIATVTASKYNGDLWTKNVSCTSKSTTFYVNLVKDLGFTASNYYYASVSLVFIDPKTNTKATDQAFVYVVPFVYTLSFVNDFSYRPGQTFSYTLVAKTVDGNPVKKLSVSLQTNFATTTVTTGNDGIFKGVIKTNSSRSDYLTILATCKECSSGYTYAYPIGVRPYEGISLSLITIK
jgi:hypothetical protein